MPTSPRIRLPYPDEDSSPWNEVFKAMVEAIDLSLYSHREDRNTIFSGGGNMSFTASSGVLTWAEDIDLLAAFTGYRWRIQGPGSIALLDSQLAYLTIARAPQSLAVYTLTVGNVTPNEPRGDDQYIICYRKGSKLYFRNGKALGDGQTADIFESSGAGTVYKDEGVAIAGAPHSTVNFVGSGITATNAGGGQVNVSVNAGAVIQDEGSPLAGAPHTTLNFAGAGVTATNAGGGVALVTIPQGAPTIQEEGSPLAGGPHSTLNFVGSAVTAANAGGGVATITVSALTGLVVKDEGSTVTGGPHTALNFIGAVVSVADAGAGQANVTVSGVTALPEVEASLVSGLFSTTNASFTRAGSRLLDPLYWPATIGTLTRQIYFKADIEVSNAATTANVRLRNIIDNETVTGTAMNSVLVANTEVTSPALTVGVGVGDLKSGTPKMYEVQVSLTGGGGGDTVSITNARLCVRYV